MFPMYHVNLHKSPKLALKMSTKQRNNVFLHPLPLSPPKKPSLLPRTAARSLPRAAPQLSQPTARRSPLTIPVIAVAVSHGSD